MARRAQCLTQLVTEVNATFPARDKASDGWLGDQAHAARKSDHNPNAQGVVRAQDIDEDLDPRNPHAAEAIVQLLVGMGRNGDRRLNPSGYVIYEGRIWSAAYKWAERRYTGANAHAKHFHVSCGSDPVGYGSTARWGIRDLFPPAPPPLPKKDVLNMPIIYSNDADGEQIYDSGSTRIVLSSGKSSETLRKAGVPITDPPLPRADFDKLKEGAK